MSDPQYILILDDEFQIDVTEIKEYEPIDEYYYICDVKFLSEEDAFDYIVEKIDVIPERKSFESQGIYCTRIRRKLQHTTIFK